MPNAYKDEKQAKKFIKLLKQRYNYFKGSPANCLVARVSKQLKDPDYRWKLLIFMAEMNCLSERPYSHVAIQL